MTTSYRFSMSRQPANIPGPFSGIADGGGFFTGIENNSGYSFATSWTHILTAKRVNELRLGYNRLHSSRFQFNYNTDVSGSVGFPGVPYAAGTDNGGLPQMTFNDVATLGSPTYLPSNEIQNTYSISDTFTLIAGNQSWKFGAEYRPEEFTIYQPAASRGELSFGTQYTDNPAAQGTGGSGVGFAYQVAPRVVVRSAFGVFYNGDENGPYSNPSPGFNPPYFASQSFNAPCSQSSFAGSLHTIHCGRQHNRRPDMPIFFWVSRRVGAH